MSYCTWGFEAKGSVPKSSGPTHSPRNYQSSAIATIPAGTGATASPALTALHLPETNQNHLFAVRLIWALPLPSLIFWIPVFPLTKYFLSKLINSQQHWTQRITFKGSHYSGPKTTSALIFTSVMLLCDCLGGCRKKYCRALTGQPTTNPNAAKI